MSLPVSKANDCVHPSLAVLLRDRHVCLCGRQSGGDGVKAVKLIRCPPLLSPRCLGCFRETTGGRILAHS